MEKKSRRGLTIVLSLMLVMMIALPVFAYEEPYRMVFLPATEYSRETETVHGTYKLFDGVNYSMSTRELRLQAFYTTGSGWKADVYRNIAINSTLGNTSTTRFSTERMWKLVVRNNTAWSKGGVGRGNIWYAQ